MTSDLSLSPSPERREEARSPAAGVTRGRARFAQRAGAGVVPAFGVKAFASVLL